MDGGDAFGFASGQRYERCNGEVFGEFGPMYASVVGMWFRFRRDIGCIAVVPGIALVCEVVEAGTYEDETQGRDSPSADCWHCVWEVVGLGERWSIEFPHAFLPDWGS